jgi:HNH endonuclease
MREHVFVPRYTESAAREAIAASMNWSQALRKLGLRAAGGNHRVLKQWARAWQIPTGHFDPYAHVGPHLRSQRIPLEDVLVEHSTYNRGSLKKRLFESGLKDRTCELCGQGEEWRGRRMSLILDHINGVHDDNRLENLQIVCPNCAATLSTHCARNRRARICPTCGIEFRRRSLRQQYCCLRCWHDSEARKSIDPQPRYKVERPSYERLLADLRELSWVAVGTKYGVSDNAVRKWIRRYERGLRM